MNLRKWSFQSLCDEFLQNNFLLLCVSVTSSTGGVTSLYDGSQADLEVRSYSYFSRLVQLSNIYCIVFSWYQKRECTFIFAISAVTGERREKCVMRGMVTDQH